MFPFISQLTAEERCEDQQTQQLRRAEIVIGAKMGIEE